MRNLHLVPLIGLIAATLTLTTYAAGEAAGKEGAAAIWTDAGAQTQAVPLAQVRPMQRASDLIGADVRNQEKTLHGKVEDIVLSQNREKIDFLAVSLQQGEQKQAGATAEADVKGQTLYQIPFDQLKITSDGETLIIDRKHDQLGQLKSIPKDNWPKDLENQRASKLMDITVQSAQGEAVGNVRDLLIDSKNGSISEATVGIGGFLGIREKLASVDWKQVKFTETVEHVEVNLTEDKLNEVAYSREQYWERLGFAGEDERKKTDKPGARQMKQPIREGETPEPREGTR